MLKKVASSISMAVLPIASFILLVSAGAVAQSTSATIDESAMTPPPPPAPNGESYLTFLLSAEGQNPARIAKRLSRFFLVEQPSAQVSQVLSVAFKSDPPGGVVFWNFSKGGAPELASTIAHYSKILKANGHLPSFFSIDYEGGGLTMAPSGRSIPGIQRFRTGFTDLAHGVWLGRSMRQFGTELCDLHGRIMGKELSAAGVNYPLTLVTDLAQRLFAVRGVSTNPAEVAACVSAFVKGVAQGGPVVAVTKHFPGLGQNNGDTHDVESISTAKTIAESNQHLFPFRDVIGFANQQGIESRLSVMSSHGKFPLLDPNHITTESPTILNGILRDQLRLQGVRVSDAMWMGDYGKLQGEMLYAAYANAFVSGTDLLMIPGSRYGGALKAFTAIADGTASPSLRKAIENRTAMTFDQFRSQFLSRVTESLDRLDRTLRTLPLPHEAMLAGAPRDQTARERARYYEILRSLDQRWISELGTATP